MLARKNGRHVHERRSVVGQTASIQECSRATEAFSSAVRTVATSSHLSLELFTLPFVVRAAACVYAVRGRTLHADVVRAALLRQAQQVGS